MSSQQIASLRRKLIEIDGKLLALLMSDEPLDEAHYQKISVYEAARNSVWRLLAAAEAEGSS